MRLTALLVVPGLLWPVPVLSQELSGFFSADDLYNACNAQSAACAAYVAGAADAFGTGWRHVLAAKQCNRKATC